MGPGEVNEAISDEGRWRKKSFWHETVGPDFLDHAFRWGGEEFLLLLPETPAESAMIAAERLREKISSLEIRIRNISISLTMTFGISMMRNGEPMSEAIDRADAALLAGKRAGRNCVELAPGD